MKKKIFDILIIALAFLLFTVWYQKCIRYPVQTSSSSLLRFYKVYLITTDEKYQFWQYVNDGAADMAAIAGVKYSRISPEERSTQKQIDAINQAVDDGAKGLMIVADDPRLISGSVEDAKARGVKVIYIDSPANEEVITTLSTDNYEAGFTAGQKMISNLEESGINSGSIGIIDIKAKVTTRQREEGFRNALAAKPEYKVLQTVYTNGDPTEAQQAAEQMINENKDLVGLFGTNEGTSLGIGNAIKDDGNRLVGVGFDKSDATMKLFRNGSLKVIIAQNPYSMGYLGMAEIIAALLGKDTGPSLIDTGFSVLEKE